ncbi:MAG: hypothetical protein HY376_01280 [Candidatus Blackburnbacteria bacterium]|nr:hypothetical protein [Candidatus Blackburnbacteria bacterium]
MINSILPKEPLLRRLLLASLLSIALSGILLAIVYQHLPPQVPLFYSHPWGREQLVPPYLLPLPLLISFLFFAANAYLAQKVFSGYPFVRQSLLISIFLTIILGVITVTRIILLIG